MDTRDQDDTFAAARALGWAQRVWRHLRLGTRTRRLKPEDAYRLWSESYETQSDNAVLSLEEEVLIGLLSAMPPAGRAVVDIGCGTGRHWPRLRLLGPSSLCGVDSSPEMLEKLRSRYPDATLHVRRGTTIEPIAAASVDLVVSTLMLGYAPCVEDEIAEWVRLLRSGGGIILTDLHPAALEAGMKRTFAHRGKTFEIEHSAYTHQALRAIASALDLDVVLVDERPLPTPLRIRLGQQKSFEPYRAALAGPLVLGMALRKRR